LFNNKIKIVVNTSRVSLKARQSRAFTRRGAKKKVEIRKKNVFGAKHRTIKKTAASGFPLTANARTLACVAFAALCAFTPFFLGLGEA
jgi:hypothetical protein